MESPNTESNPEPTMEAPEIARLLVEHRALLLGYLLACVRNYADAEDLFQEVSLAATKSAADLCDAEGFVPWAREIARRRALSYFRKSKRHTATDPDLVNRLAESAAQLDQADEIPERIYALHTCIEALPTEHRKLIALRYVDYSEPVETLAEQFGRSIQGTYALLKRIRLLLRDCVAEKMNQSNRSI